VRIWGLGVDELHRAFWASHGVSVAVLGDGRAPDPDADLFLLVEPGQFVAFDLRSIAESLLWSRAGLISVAIRDETPGGYRESVVLDAAGRVVRVERHYGGESGIIGEILLARRIDDARAWSEASTVESAEARMRAARHRESATCPGKRYVANDRESAAAFLRDIVRRWSHPDRVLVGVSQIDDGVFARTGAVRRDGDRFVGPLWIGDRDPDGVRPLVAIGPGFVADEVAESAVPASLSPIREIFSPKSERGIRWRPGRGGLYAPAKRLIDIVFASVALALASPVLLCCAIAVVVDDGFPVFFGHVRQKQGGTTFRCWKLRTMRRDAEARLAEYQRQNLCDGPQVLIRDDPRITRIGRLLRKFQLDEFPQFWNVILGDMSIVGPRPSPEKENQFCPAWREIRLSVRPGVTGLWQVMRTRAPGLDFQEWIKYDIEYVERMSPWLDAWIVWQTVVNILRDLRKGAAQPGGEPGARLGVLPGAQQEGRPERQENTT